MEIIPVCESYQYGDKIITDFPYGEELELSKPNIIYKKGWNRDISGCRTFKELPEEAKDYIEYLEKAVGCKITYVSVGAERDAYLTR